MFKRKLLQNMLRTRHDLLLVFDNTGNELDALCRHIDLKSGAWHYRFRKERG